jgi:hypothetical protein
MNTDSARERNRQMVEDEADTHLHMIIDREIADMMERSDSRLGFGTLPPDAVAEREKLVAQYRVKRMRGMAAARKKLIDDAHAHVERQLEEPGAPSHKLQ